jgi:rhodanese-related sulfurtransferase
METLQLLGYSNVKSLSGGFNAWKAADFPVITGEVAAPVAGVAPLVDQEMFAILDEYLATLPDGFAGIKPDALKEQMAAAAPFLLDVREPKELTDNGYIEGAVNIPLRTLTDNLDKLPALDQPIVVYCAVGHRGAIAMETLQLLGYSNVKSLSGGFNAWKAADFPVIP